MPVLCALLVAETYLHPLQDGTIQFEAKLTGCLSTNVLSEGEGPMPTHGTLVGPVLNAQVHQHFFNVRMDMAVDDNQGGKNLTVTEVSFEIPVVLFPSCVV